MLKLFLLSFLLSEVCCALKFDSEHDFIIVGGGSAGCVLAGRLSENTEFKVLLLEAGGHPPELSRMPAMAASLMATDVDWQFYTEPQENAMLSNPEHRAYWPRGKMLGGTGGMNGMAFHRGNKRDYDQWEKEGNKGWDWQSILPYFEKLEAHHNSNSNQELHGKNGPFHVKSSGENIPIVRSFVKAVNELGYNESDPNDGEQVGVHYMPSIIFNGERETSYTQYVRPIENCRKNLKIETNAFVERILFDENKRAIGVLCSQNGSRFAAKAIKEVLLSAGTINSPHLLMLSGIGPRTHLESLGIEVIADLPVGENLQDHYGVSVPAFAKKFEQIFTNETIADFYLKRKGPLTEMNFGNAFINTKYANEKDPNFPDIELAIHPLFLQELAPTGIEFAFLHLSLLRPKSKGTIKLKSKKASDKPLIDPRYLTEEDDLKVLVDGLKILNQVKKRMNISGTDYSEKTISVPACDRYEKESDEFWECVAKYATFTDFHPTGSCKMGPKDSVHSVVDENLNVIGVSGLRVVDASVMPSIVSSPVQTATFMIAERAADIINQKYSIRIDTDKHYYHEL
ncbi:glucose dehydrogenase-like [FAD: quinone] [Dinothrombium tinctorium]|uniref:Glucose dehydrogenase-like [FAD: quinone] n=1 Tax=Dinothrombium tinctorium TaxID=1965070 RepID=A0A3S3P3C5_9ACAR|nr:glucose dehydrogenase-like [FAD: quinone] [Dinothrombium tinctorium]